MRDGILHEDKTGDENIEDDGHTSSLCNDISAA